MRIIRAQHLGMCFGVRDAIQLALSQAVQQPLTILGDLVHNESVLAELQARGVRSASDVSSVQTGAVMITAHGASEKTLQRLRHSGLHLMQATCPLVHVAHRAVQKLVAEGYYPVIIGQRGHVEVRGLTEDLEDFDIVLSEPDVYELRQHPRFGIAAQTTQPIDKVRHLVALIRERFPDSEVRFIDTVCQPTKQRQDAAIDLAQKSDVVIVIGGTHSNNTRELVETCRRFCRKVHHVQNPNGLNPEWFQAANNVGITAGTSTPDSIIDAVEQRIVALSQEQTRPALDVSPVQNCSM